MDSRLVAGNLDLWLKFQKTFKQEILNKNKNKFFYTKIKEKRKRHIKMGDTSYLVEPNIKEGKGVSIGSLTKGRGTTYEFSTSNPMWRASLETLDFLPLTTVDYSGGIIITDWYSDNNSAKESIKISLRFLANEIRSESLKVIVHQKTCSNNLNCKIILLSNTKIKEELHSTILRKAALLEKESKKKKKK